MEQSDDKIRTVERALTEAYRAGAASAIGEVDVTQAVMRDIRRSVDDGNRWGASVVLDQLVWRTATITAAVVLVAAVLTVGMFRTTPGESAWLLAEEFESAPLFGE